MENEGKRMAWFPAPYLERIDDDEDGDEDDIDGTPERGAVHAQIQPPLYPFLKTTLDSFTSIQCMFLHISHLFHSLQECCTVQSRATRPPKMMR